MVRLERCIYKRQKALEVRLCVNKRRMQARFPLNDYPSFAAAVQDARRFRDTRSKDRGRAKQCPDVGISESVSVIKGRCYLYLKARRGTKVVKSTCVGNLVSDNTNSRKRLRGTDKYQQKLSELRNVIGAE